MATPLVQPGLQTSPVFRVRGQRSRWRYPHPRAEPEYCEVIRNMNLSERGTADSRNGYAGFTTSVISGAENIVGLTQQTFLTHGTQQLISTPTKVISDNGSTQKNII